MGKQEYLLTDEFLLNRTQDILDSKWKVYLIYTLDHEVWRFGALKRLFHYISRMTLTRYLHELERDGLLTRTEYPAPPLRTEYSLTSLGLSVYPIVERLIEWGER